MHPLGFLRLTAASTSTEVANPKANRHSIEHAIKQFHDSDVIVFGELCLSGYTCGELFVQTTLLQACLDQLAVLVDHCRRQQLIVVGLPISVDGKLFNVAAVFGSGRLLGMVPKQHLPNYQEYYEGRWFHSGSRIEQRELNLHPFRTVPFGTDLLFECEQSVVGVEICEDLWVPLPPSSYQTIAGANVLLNLSASNETIGKASYRRQLVTMQSGKCNAAYAYASAGPSESTTDLVFGGHCIIAENGVMHAESKRVGTGLGLRSASSDQGVVSHVTVDIDIDRIAHDRRVAGTMHQSNTLAAQTRFRRIPFELEATERPLVRFVDAHPFVPKQTSQLEQRCAEIFEIQCAALAKRVSRLPTTVPLVIGVSGGLDSTLALIVARKMFDMLELSPQRLVGMNLPGFGTTNQTRDNAIELMSLLGIVSETIDIRENCFRIFQNLHHRPFGLDLSNEDWRSLQDRLESLPEDNRQDLVFENVQARMRTMLLMNRGFVIGTGDLSEAALGWSTYNADHMSMYNVNCSIPKTLVRFLVRYVAEHLYDGPTRRVLLDIAETPISPELLPLTLNKTMHQSTEATIGPYELHDFFLYHFVRFGASPAKILLLAEHANFDRDYSCEELKRHLKVFIQRFFSAQYKRSCVPDGPKVGTVSLSPRGDWRMPSDADPSAWIGKKE
jgi:NAD+ synthase (glutamine-hydrolysing)